MSKSLFSRYLFVLLAALIVFVSFPLPYAYTHNIRYSGYFHKLQLKSDTVLFGSSTIDMRSVCDADHRSITEMLSDKLGRPVMDASYPGQTFEDSINFAAIAAKFPAIDRIIMTAGWVELLDKDNMSLRDYVLFRSLNPALYADGPLNYFRSIDAVFSGAQKPYNPFTYAGKQYPGLEGFNHGLFAAETKARTCPENDGHDAPSISAIYYHMLIQHEAEPANLRLVETLRDNLTARQKSLIFVMTPVNFEKLGQIDARWPAMIRERRDRFLSQLRATNINVLDLSEALPNEQFIDRWCACAHFSQDGRSLFADRLAAFLAKPANVATRM